MGIYKELSHYLKISENQCVKNFESFDINKEWNGRESIESFYANTDYYLYDLTQYANDIGRMTYSDELSKFVKDKQIKTALDYGCGIGTDTLTMLRAGVEYCSVIDVASPCQDYLLTRFGPGTIFQFRSSDKNDMVSEAESFYKYYLDITTNDTFNSFKMQDRVDLSVCIAVLEHVEKPREMLERIIEKTGKYLILRVDPTFGESQPMHLKENADFLTKVDKEDEPLLKELGIKRVKHIHIMPMFEIVR